MGGLVGAIVWLVACSAHVLDCIPDEVTNVNHTAPYWMVEGCTSICTS